MLDLTELSVEIRSAMLAEVEWDAEAGRIIPPQRLTGAGRAAYTALLRAAVRDHDARWLGEQMCRPGQFRVQPTPAAGVAAPAAADEEFNRYYIRGICRVARSRGDAEVVVCRSRSIARPDAESEDLVGRAVEVGPLLSALRSAPGVGAALGLRRAGDPGLTVCLGRGLPSAFYPAPEPQH